MPHTQGNAYSALKRFFHFCYVLFIQTTPDSCQMLHSVCPTSLSTQICIWGRKLRKRVFLISSPYLSFDFTFSFSIMQGHHTCNHRKNSIILSHTRASKRFSSISQKLRFHSHSNVHSSSKCIVLMLTIMPMSSYDHIMHSLRKRRKRVFLVNWPIGEKLLTTAGNHHCTSTYAKISRFACLNHSRQPHLCLNPKNVFMLYLLIQTCHYQTKHMVVSPISCSSCMYPPSCLHLVKKLTKRVSLIFSQDANMMGTYNLSMRQVIQPCAWFDNDMSG